MTTNLIPGTVYRIFLEGGSVAHYTGVLLKNGGVLEVKTPDLVSKKRVFNSLDEWCNERGFNINKAIVDTSNASGVVIGSDTHGFNYPTKKIYKLEWLRWCYEMIVEGAPHLLEDNEVRTAYNKFAELCVKHENCLSFNGFNRGARYDLFNLRWGVTPSTNSAYKYQIPVTLLNNQLNANSSDKVTIDKVTIDVFANQYKVLLDLIYPHLYLFMKQQHMIDVKKTAIKCKRKTVNRYHRRIAKLSAQIDIYTKYITRMEEEISRLEA